MSPSRFPSSWRRSIMQPAKGRTRALLVLCHHTLPQPLQPLQRAQIGRQLLFVLRETSACCRLSR